MGALLRRESGTPDLRFAASGEAGGESYVEARTRKRVRPPPYTGLPSCRAARGWTSYGPQQIGDGAGVESGSTTKDTKEPQSNPTAREVRPFRARSCPARGSEGCGVGEEGV